MGKTPFIVQLRNGLAAAKNYTAGLFGATLSAVREMEDTKADKGACTRVTIQASGWRLPEDQEPPAASETYPYFYDLKAEGVTALDRASVTISMGSLLEAASCGLCPTCETGNGSIRLWSAGKPGEDIEAEYWIEQGAEPSALLPGEGNE